MIPELDALVARARHLAETPAGDAPGADRLRLERLAAEFESTLMLQVLKEMRRAGRWEDDGEAGGFGSTNAIFDMLDVELASQLAQKQGLGLTAQVVEAFERSVAPGRAAEGATADRGAGVALGLRAADLAGHVVTSGFGWRQDPLTGELRFHRGVDIRAAYGQDVPVAADGRVVFSGSQGGYGTTVVVQHADGTRARYAHLSVALVAEGESVSAGHIVGRVGSTGRATGPHLHFERLDRHGNAIDPGAR